MLYIIILLVSVSVHQLFSVFLFWQSLALTSERGRMEREILPEIILP